MKFSSALILCLSLGASDVASGFVEPLPKSSLSKKIETSSPTTCLSMSSAATNTKEKTMGAKTAGLLVNHRYVVDELHKVDPQLSEMERLRFALQFDSLTKATQAVQDRQAWRQGPGKDICEAAAAAVEAAQSSGAWDNTPVYESAPFATAINQYITPKSVMTLSTDDGDLVYVIRASAIDDKELMDKVTVEQLGDYFLYAKEVHSLVANQRSASTGRLCNVIFANDISGVRKAPDKRFSKALTSSSDAYEVLYPSLAGPTMILNLPFILQALSDCSNHSFPNRCKNDWSLPRHRYWPNFPNSVPWQRSHHAPTLCRRSQVIVAVRTKQTE